MADDYFVLVAKQSEMNATGPTPAADTFIVTVQQGSTIDNELTGNFTGKVTVDGKTGYLRAGPFTSLADAQAYLKTGAQTVPGAIPGTSITPQGQTQILNPLSGIEGVARIIGDFFTGITDGKMWRSLGWLLLGILLTLAGAALWLKGSLNPIAGLRALRSQ